MDLLRWESQVHNALDYRPSVKKWLKIREKILEQLVNKVPKVKLNRHPSSKEITKRRESCSKHLSDNKISTSGFIKKSEAQIKKKTVKRQLCNNLVRILNLETDNEIPTRNIESNKYNVKVDLDRNNVRVTLFDHIINKCSNLNKNERAVDICNEVENRILNDEFENSFPSTSNNTQFKKPIERRRKIRKRSSSTNQKSESIITSKKAKLKHEKSDIARYVELFSNDCSENVNSSSASSTTPHIEWVQDANKFNKTEIAYILKDEWNSDKATTSNVQTQQEDLNMTFEEFMSFVDGTLIDIDNNEIACVLNESTVSGRESQSIVNNNEKNEEVENGSVSNLAFSYDQQPLDLSKKTTSTHKESDVNIDLVNVTALGLIEQSPNNISANDDDSDVSTVNSIMPSSNDSGIDVTADIGFKAGLSMPLLECNDGTEWLENYVELLTVDNVTENNEKKTSEQVLHEKDLIVNSSTDEENIPVTVRTAVEKSSKNISENDDPNVSAEHSIIASSNDSGIDVTIDIGFKAGLGTLLLEDDNNVQIEQTEGFNTTQVHHNNSKENEDTNSADEQDSLICSLSVQDTGWIKNYGELSTDGNGAEMNEANTVKRDFQNEDFMVKSLKVSVEKENISVNVRRVVDKSSINISANNDTSKIALSYDSGVDDTTEIGFKAGLGVPLLEGNDNMPIEHNTEKENNLISVLKELTLLEIEGEIDKTILDCDEIDDDLISLMASSLGSPTADRLDDFNLPKEMNSKNNGESESTQMCKIVNNELVENTVTSFKLNSRDNITKATSETTITSSIQQGLQNSSSESNESTFANEIIEKEKFSSVVKSFNLNPKNNGTSEITLNSRMSQRYQQSFLPNYQIPKKPQVIEMDSPQLFPSVDVRNSNEEKQNKIDQNSTFTNVKASGNGQITITINIYEILPIFGATCCLFSRSICTELFCRYSHQLNNACITRNRLEAFPFHSLNIIYKYVRRSSLLFRTYFEIFCDIFANRKCRLKLLNMVYDCQLQSDCCLFLKIIYQCLIKCGMYKTIACRQLLKRTKDKSLATVNVLTDIIIDADATKFCDVLDNFISIPYYKFQMSSLNALALKAIQDNHIELSSIILKCLINVDTHEFMTMKSPELVQLLEMVKNSSF